MHECFDQLRAAVLTIDPDIVREAAWHVHAVCTTTFSMLNHSTDASHQDAAFSFMKAYVTTVHDVVAQTLLPGKQRAAAECATVLVDEMLKMADALRHGHD